MEDKEGKVGTVREAGDDDLDWMVRRDCGRTRAVTGDADDAGVDCRTIVRGFA